MLPFLSGYLRERLRQMWFSDAPTPAHRIPEVSGSALPVGRAARAGRRGGGGRRRRLLRGRRRSGDGGDRGRLGWQVGRVAVAGDQRLDHLDDFVAVGRRIRVEQRGRRRRGAGHYSGGGGHGRAGRRRCFRCSRARRWGFGRRRFGHVRVVGQVSVLWNRKHYLYTNLA